MIEKLDENDRAILRLLQRDATVSLETMAQELAMSTNSCWRRVQRMQKNGIILRRVAIVSPAAVGLSLTVYMAVRTNDHSDAWLGKFAAAASAMDEVVEFCRMAGEVDYLLKLVVRDVAHYDQAYKRLIAAVSLTDVSASFVMEQIKYETALPI